MSESEKNTGIHANHRARMKKRFSQSGFAGFDDFNVLEILLYYAIPRCDTNEIAHELINEFGSLSGVFEADAASLCEVPGIGEDTALLIKLVPQLWKRYLTDIAESKAVILSSSDAAEYLRPRFIGDPNETFIAVMLDGAGNVRKTTVIDEGGINSVSVNVNKIFREALNSGAASVIAAHNHPGGYAKPSQQDVSVTALLKEKLSVLGIELKDHLVFSRSEAYSMAEERIVT